MKVTMRGTSFISCGIGLHVEGSDIEIDSEDTQFVDCGTAIVAKECIPEDLFRSTVSIIQEQARNGAAPSENSFEIAAGKSGLAAWCKANGVALATLTVQLWDAITR